MKTINSITEEMISNKKVSPRKIKNIILIKKFIDRMAGRKFIPDSEINKIEAKYGVKPAIQTWGDYFQIEIVRDHVSKSDFEFEKIIQTVSFDIISSILIFSGKDEKFFEFVKERNIEISLKDPAKLNSEDEENIHLGILLNYYQEMGLSMDHMTNEDFSYFESFALRKAVS
ncbi:MAG: hypothetical protein OEZ22_10590 [Spirochaetia bacterium]|nr:hypothetical protein [Spirochaetia bacterium]